MDICEAPAKSSHSSSSRGSTQKKKSQNVIPEQRSFLRTSFGQRFSAQCGAIQLDTSICQDSTRDQSVRATPLVVSSGGDEKKKKLTNSASGRGSSGLSEVDLALKGGTTAANNVNEVNLVKPWRFPVGAVPKQRALAMVGSAAGEIAAAKQQGKLQLKNEISETESKPPKPSLILKDCGFLKLLPSKRKLSLEQDHDEDDEQRNYNSTGLGKPVVGSFMKWMIDVGKGLAKNRSTLEQPDESRLLREDMDPEMTCEVEAEMICGVEQEQEQQQKLQDHDHNHDKAGDDNETVGVNDDQGNQSEEVLEKPQTLGIKKQEEVATAAAAAVSFGFWQQPSELAPKQLQNDLRNNDHAEFCSTEQFIASLNNWVNNSRKKKKKSDLRIHANDLNDRKSGGRGVIECRFCGLTGHSVGDCSETLDCELKELERRAIAIEEISSGDFPCLRCLGMGHLGAQCRFSVTEAASRARQNTTMRSWPNLSTSTTITTTPDVCKKLKAITTPAEDDNGCKKLKAIQQQHPLPPTGLLAAVESARLSRSQLWRCADARGFFLRLRFGKWEKDLGGTGYRMARIRGVLRKDDKNSSRSGGGGLSVCVDLGDMDCSVDSQYVSNHSFTEAELVEWWRGRWKCGKRLLTPAQVAAKAISLRKQELG